VYKLCHDGYRQACTLPLAAWIPSRHTPWSALLRQAKPICGAVLPHKVNSAPEIAVVHSISFEWLRNEELQLKCSFPFAGNCSLTRSGQKFDCAALNRQSCEQSGWLQTDVVNCITIRLTVFVCRLHQPVWRLLRCQLDGWGWPICHSLCRYVPCCQLCAWCISC
jgi:hypothetical protein